MADGNGRLTIKEFTNGIRRMKGGATAKDVIDVCKKLRGVQEMCNMTRLQVNSLREELGALEQDIVTITHDTSETLGLFQEMLMRFQAHMKNCNQEDRRDTQMRKFQRLKTQAGVK